MNAADRKTARKAILRQLREYAKAERVYRLALAVKSAPFPDDEARRSSHHHSVCIAVTSFARSLNLIGWDESSRYDARRSRILDAKVTRGVPVVKVVEKITAERI